MDCCPVCNIDLGCIPVEKLRPDHNMHDIVSKVFPPKKSMVKAPEVTVPSISLPLKRKERSLSSLVVSTPKVSVQTNLIGRRTKAPKRSAAQGGSQFSGEVPNKKEEEYIDNCAESSSSEALNKFPNKHQLKETSTTTPYSSNLKCPGGAGETGIEPRERNAKLWTPLNCLLEVATGTKPSKFDYQDVKNANQESDGFSKKEYLISRNKAKSDKPDEGESYMFGSNEREIRHRMKVEEEDKARTLLAGEVRSRRLHAMKRKRSAAAAKLVPPQVVMNAMRDKQDRRNSPIWFSLVASVEQEGCSPLPQISANYLRVKDGNLPVVFIQKYLTKKLDLANESEVQVMCHGQTMHPSLRLHDLVDLWVKATSRTKKVSTTMVGASAKDFVMILSYARSSGPAG
uniref:E3 ubiquitin protein ligase DRIP2 n=1 Tax=Kalanchoe fedtschenkoi TaxID=63787 RepID=A0A7N0SVV3_KALFE